MTMRLRHVPRSILYASEPNPAWFGNPPNESRNPNWDREVSNNWLKSRFHFSFAEYSNYANSNFGVLRVMNDDFVQPNRGFGTHGHSNMEIVTYIIQGDLTHEDSMGTSETLGRGSVQFMTAGRGVRHSEFNVNKDKGLRFIQTWIVPRQNGLVPNYGSFDPTAETGKKECTARNQWRHLVSDVQDESTDTPVQIEQDANLFVAEMDPKQSIDLEIKSDRMAYVLCVEGSVKLDDGNGKEVTLERHDGCEIIPVKSGDAGKVKFEAVGSEKAEDGTDIGAHVLVYEMKRVEGAGRRDIKDS
jgi:redox-sensitive bicupin YhaK (pirin superfamily)